MAHRQPHPQTILHLVPNNEHAMKFLGHPENERFVSTCRTSENPRAGNPSTPELGFEIGYHVSSRHRADIICEVGRNADIILNDPFISGVQFSVEMHPESKAILLYDRSRCRTTKIFPKMRSGFYQLVLQEAITYTIELQVEGRTKFEFELRWNKQGEDLQQIAQEYETVLRGSQNLRWARTREAGYAGVPIRYNTRLRTSPIGVERVIETASMGKGAFGEVSKAIDIDTGGLVAVKKMKLPHELQARDFVLTNMKREIKILLTLSHKNIVKCLGWKEDDNSMKIYMELKDGNVNDLIRNRPQLRQDCNFIRPLLKEMLEALDFLAFRRLCHRDVKPDNILFAETKGNKYSFYLADFGLTNYQRWATTWCGTLPFMAPELLLGLHETQSPKVDIWSLFVTIMVITEELDISLITMCQALFNKSLFENHFLSQVRAAAARHPELAPMARENPDQRASAAQMLIRCFQGDGLTTPPKRVLPIQDESSGRSNTDIE